ALSRAKNQQPRTKNCSSRWCLALGSRKTAMLHTLRWPLTRIFYSLRWRLTGWYVLLLTAVLLLFSAGTYVAVYKLLLDNFDDLLASQANLIVQTIDFSDRNLTLQNDALRADHRNDEHLTRIYRADRT